MSWQRSMHHLKISTIFHCNNLTSFSNHWKNLRFSWPALNLCDGISWYRFYLCMKSTHKIAFTHLTFYTILRETADVDTYKIKQWTYSHSGYEIYSLLGIIKSFRFVHCSIRWLFWCNYSFVIISNSVYTCLHSYHNIY